MMFQPLSTELRQRFSAREIQGGCALYIYAPQRQHERHHQALLDMGLSVCAVSDWGALENVLDAGARLGVSFDLVVTDLPPHRPFLAELYPELRHIPLVTVTAAAS